MALEGLSPSITEFELNTVTVEGRDDLAYVVGTYALTMTLPGAPGPVEDTGKYVEIRHRQADAKWLIAVDIWSSDLPLPGPPE